MRGSLCDVARDSAIDASPAQGVGLVHKHERRILEEGDLQVEPLRHSFGGNGGVPRPDDVLDGQEVRVLGVSPTPGLPEPHRLPGFLPRTRGFQILQYQ